MSVEIYVASYNHHAPGIDEMVHHDTRHTIQLAQYIKDIGLTFDRVYGLSGQRSLDAAKLICEKLNISERPDSVFTSDEWNDNRTMPVQEMIRRIDAHDTQTEQTIAVLDDDAYNDQLLDLVMLAHKAIIGIRSRQRDGTALLIGDSDMLMLVYAAVSGRSYKEVVKEWSLPDYYLMLVNHANKVQTIKLPQNYL